MKLDYAHGNITYQMFSLAAAGVMNTVSVFRWLSGTGEEKMDPDKSVVFGYDGVPAHLDLAVPSPYVHNLCFPTQHRRKGFKLLKVIPKADISSPEIQRCISGLRGQSPSNPTSAGGSLRFWTGGQLSLTPGQRISKARSALPARGVRGHAPPENF